jgi:ribosomal protein S18
MIAKKQKFLQSALIKIDYKDIDLLSLFQRNKERYFHVGYR